MERVNIMKKRKRRVDIWGDLIKSPPQGFILLLFLLAIFGISGCHKDELPIEPNVSENFVVVQGDILLNIIEEELQKIDDEFLLDNHNVHIYDNGQGIYTVDFMRTAGGFELNSGYTVAIKNDVIVNITDNTCDVTVAVASAETLGIKIGLTSSSKGSSSPLDNEKLHEKLEISAMNNAASETLKDNSKEIVDQEVYYYYDVQANIAYILVYTNYYLSGTEAMGSDLYMMPIDDDLLNNG